MDMSVTSGTGAGQEGIRIGKSDSLEYQTGPSGFPKDSSSSWSLA
jgi:hypothetical protein